MQIIPIMHVILQPRICFSFQTSTFVILPLSHKGILRRKQFVIPFFFLTENHIHHKVFLQYLVYLLGTDMYLFLRLIKLCLLQNICGVRSGRSAFSAILLTHYTHLASSKGPQQTHVTLSFCSQVCQILLQIIACTRHSTLKERENKGNIETIPALSHMRMYTKL